MAVEFVDTHCHIQSAGDGEGQNAGERITREKWAKSGHSGKELIQRASEAGVTRLICVGCDLKDSQLAVDFVQNEPNAWASIGIHPHEAKHYVGNDAALADFAALATRDKVVAVGECGLDYFYTHATPADQEKILRFQFELALRHNLPMIFHVRGGASSAEPGKDAMDDFWPIFDSYNQGKNAIRGVLHSFTDTSENLDKAIERGLYIGINGIATFTRDDSQLAMYKNIPLSRLLLETDAPFLTPSPYRGTICEPYHTSVVAEFTAKLRRIDLEELADATTTNARELFRLN